MDAPHTPAPPTPTVPKHLNFITGNKNKLAEVCLTFLLGTAESRVDADITQVQAILEGVIELRNQNVDLVEIQGTVEEVTTDKARRAAEAVSTAPVLVYQSSIRVSTSTSSTYIASLNTLIIIRLTPFPGQRSSACRRHMSLFQGDERPPRSLYASLPLNC